MGNCGSIREREKPTTIKSPNGNNQFNNNGKNFIPLKKEEESSKKPYRTTPVPQIFGETGEAKLIF